jgi:hypothetical protein
MNRRSIIVVIFITLFLQDAFSQSKIHAELDFGYMIGLTERGDQYKINRSLYNMHTNSIRLSGMYRLSNLYSIGAGIGMERYESPGYNTLPVFAVLRYTPALSIPKGYIYTDLGYSIGTSTMTPGLLWDLGIGHQWMFRKHFGLKAQVGYNLKQLKTDSWTSESSTQKVSQWRHSLSLFVGIVF